MATTWQVVSGAPAAERGRFPKLTVPVVLLLSPTAQHRYRNEVPQHHPGDSPSSRVGCGPCVLSGQHGCGCGCGCGKFGTKLVVIGVRADALASSARRLVSL